LLGSIIDAESRLARIVSIGWHWRFSCVGGDVREWVAGAEPNPGGAPYALLAREEPDGLVYAGAAFVTLPADARERFWTRSEKIKIAKPVPARGLDARKRKVSWFRPDMRVKAKHLRGGDMLRHCSPDVTRFTRGQA
jgi:hypothetical protein